MTIKVIKGKAGWMNFLGNNSKIGIIGINIIASAFREKASQNLPCRRLCIARKVPHPGQ